MGGQWGSKKRETWVVWRSQRSGPRRGCCVALRQREAAKAESAEHVHASRTCTQARPREMGTPSRNLAADWLPGLSDDRPAAFGSNTCSGSAGGRRDGRLSVHGSSTVGGGATLQSHRMVQRAAAMDGQGIKSLQGWTMKKPTSQYDKLWAAATPQARFFELQGFLVSYYSYLSLQAKTPRATFDLREVIALCEVRSVHQSPSIVRAACVHFPAHSVVQSRAQSPDETAPALAVEVIVGRHAFTIAFEGQRDEFLDLWVNSVPAQAVSAPLLEQYGRLNNVSARIPCRVAAAVGAGAAAAAAVISVAAAPTARAAAAVSAYSHAPVSPNAAHRRTHLAGNSDSRVSRARGELPDEPATSAAPPATSAAPPATSAAPPATSAAAEAHTSRLPRGATFPVPPPPIATTQAPGMLDTVCH
jgi:hypothetical protein